MESNGIIYNEKYLEKALKIDKNLDLDKQEKIKNLLKKGLKEVELATDNYIADKSNLALMYLTTKIEPHFTLEQEKYRPIINLEFKIALALYKISNEAEISNHHIVKSVNDYMLNELAEGKLASSKDVASIFYRRCSSFEEINLVKKAYLDFTHLAICPNFGKVGEKNIKEAYEKFNKGLPLSPITDKDFDIDCSDIFFSKEKIFKTTRMDNILKIIKEDGEIEYKDVRKPVLEIKGNLLQGEHIKEWFKDNVKNINIEMPYTPTETSPFTIKIDAYSSSVKDNYHKYKRDRQIFYRVNSIVNNLNGEEIEINKVYLQKHGVTEFIPEFDYRCYEKELYKINNLDKTPIYESEIGSIFVVEPNHLIIKDGTKELDNFCLGKIISSKEINEVTIPDSIKSIGLNIFSELILTKDNSQYKAPEKEIHVHCSKGIYDMIKEGSSKEEFKMLIFDGFMDGTDIGPDNNGSGDGGNFPMNVVFINEKELESQNNVDSEFEQEIENEDDDINDSFDDCEC